MIYIDTKTRKFYSRYKNTRGADATVTQYFAADTEKINSSFIVNTFFKDKYRLIHTTTTYNKNIIKWGYRQTVILNSYDVKFND